MKADGEYPWRDLINWNCFKYLLIKRVLMLMNARSTPMTVTPMQSALTQKAHLLASATWMHITLVTGKHALLIVSRIICFTSFCSLRFTTTLTIVDFYFVGKGIHQYLCRQRATPRLPVDHLDYALVQEYTLNEISNAPQAWFSCLFFFGCFWIFCVL